MKVKLLLAPLALLISSCASFGTSGDATRELVYVAEASGGA